MSFKILQQYSIKPKSHFSQNFLFDQNIIHKIIESSIIDGDTHVIEIGAGLGSLTRAILNQNPKFVTLIELDTSFAHVLDKIQSENVKIIYQDILKLNLESILIPSLENIVVSNLPYHISSKILIKLSKQKQITRLVLMLQQDLATRIISAYGSKSYGRLSVILQNLYRIEQLFSVSRFCFYPVPKIQSSILRFVPMNNPIDPEVEKSLQQLVNISFSSRRKLVIKSLRGSINNVENIFKRLSIDLCARAEDLSPKDYLALAQRAVQE